MNKRSCRSTFGRYRVQAQEQDTQNKMTFKKKKISFERQSFGK